MNLFRRPSFLPVAALSIMVSLALMLSSCSDSPAKNDESAAILKQPPFAVLTDSIREAKSASSEAARLYFKRAEQLSQNNLHELALADYRKSWELQPAESTGLQYASTLSILGQTDAAIRLLQKCREQFPSNANFSNLLGDIYLQSGRSKEALGLYDSMLKRDSLDFEAWYEKALIQERMSDTPDAILSLQHAVSLQPVNTYTLELAHMYAETNNALALSLCDEVLRKDSIHELTDPLFIKGIYYSNTAQYKKAIVQFDSCIHRDWKFTDAYLEKGIAQFKQKNYQDALKTFQMTINVSNTYADGYYWVGRCYEMMGNKEQALLYYQQAVGLDKNFTEAKEAIQRLK